MNNLTILSGQTDEQLKAVNSFRRKNKNLWISCRIQGDRGRFIEFKSYNTTIQLLRDDKGIVFHTPYDTNVKEFTTMIEGAIDSIN